MKFFVNSKISFSLLGFVVGLLVTAALRPAISRAAETVAPIADAGLPRYAATDPVQLDGSGSYDPDNSGQLSYAWQQIAGPSLQVTGADTAWPTVSGFIQTDEIQECEFELVVSDGELTSPPDTVKVIIVPACSENLPELELKNFFFDPGKPTIIFFGGGPYIGGSPEHAWSPFRDPPWDSSAKMDTAWLSKANIIELPQAWKYDGSGGPYTFYRCGDRIIAYLSAIAPNYNQPIQTVGHSSGGMPALDVAIRLNLTYADARYAVNLVTLLDPGGRSGAELIRGYSPILANPVEGEQCWVETYDAFMGWFPAPVDLLSVRVPTINHAEVKYWYGGSLTNPDKNQFNHGVVAGAYWSVAGPGKNLQLASTPGKLTYVFKWHGLLTSGYMDYYDESQYPGRLPEPVTLVGPADGALVDANGAILTCEESENAVGYQLLLGRDPHRVMSYYIISDTPEPPTQVITAFPFEKTWWTVKVRDRYGSTIYADPICINAEASDLIAENVTTGQRYASIQDAIDAAGSGHEIVVGASIYYYQENIDFKGKNLLVRSEDPTDPSVVASTVIHGGGQNPVVTFSAGEDANCILVSFTLIGGKGGIYCSGSSPTITNCTIAGNADTAMGGGLYMEDGSSPMLTNCTIINNSASYFGGGIYNQDSSPTLTNCTFSGNWAGYFGGGIYCISGSPTVTNSIFWADTTDEICVHGGTPVITHSDVNGGWPGEGNIDADPLFADPNNGDYHLKSQSGRWDQNSQSWVKDDVTSPCIDAGDPNSPWQEELWPHGKRINKGAYGDTAQASMSLSDAGSRADCNNDGSVDARDLLMLCENWLTEILPTAADINRDGVVNFPDFTVLADNWLWKQ